MRFVRNTCRLASLPINTTFDVPIERNVDSVGYRIVSTARFRASASLNGRERQNRCKRYALKGSAPTTYRYMYTAGPGKQQCLSSSTAFIVAYETPATRQRPLRSAVFHVTDSDRRKNPHSQCDANLVTTFQASAKDKCWRLRRSVNSFSLPRRPKLHSNIRRFRR